MSFAFVIPNLSTDVSNFESETKVLVGTNIEEKVGRRGKRDELVLLLSDGSQLYLSEQYSDHWSTFQDDRSIGKTLKFYHGKNISHGHNPVQIEMDGKLIYSPAETNIYKYIILSITLGFTIWSVILIRNKIKVQKGDS